MKLRKVRPVTQSIRLKFSGGKLLAIHSDELAAVFAGMGGAKAIRRASHVEPSADSKTWSADMQPIGGPMLSGYKTRKAALKAEVAWINKNLLS